MTKKKKNPHNEESLSHIEENKKSITDMISILCRLWYIPLSSETYFTLITCLEMEFKGRRTVP